MYGKVKNVPNHQSVLPLPAASSPQLPSGSASNIAMENDPFIDDVPSYKPPLTPFIDDFPMKTSIDPFIDDFPSYKYPCLVDFPYVQSPNSICLHLAIRWLGNSK